MLIFICFVVVIVILKERSDLNWLASVPLPARLDYALPQNTADSADPSRLFCSFQVCFCLIRWSVKFGIVHWTGNSQAVQRWSFVLFLFVCLHLSWSDDFLLFFQESWFVLAELLERVRSRQFSDFFWKAVRIFLYWFLFVLWLWLRFWKSKATWTGWQACCCLSVWTALCHRARQPMLIPPVFLQLPDLFFVWFVRLLSLAWFIEFEILWPSWVRLDGGLCCPCSFVYIFSDRIIFLLYFWQSWFLPAEILERVRSRQFSDFSLKGC